MNYNISRYLEIENNILDLIQDFRDDKISTYRDDSITYASAIKTLKRKVLIDNLAQYDPNPDVELTLEETVSLNKMKSRFLQFENKNHSQYTQPKISNDYQRMYFWLLETRNQLDIERECKLYCQNKERQDIYC